ncbi:MAG: hypothetical protein AAGA46_13810 [Cyanobacteria bacterium P01_F01_bin.13]
MQKLLRALQAAPNRPQLSGAAAPQPTPASAGLRQTGGAVALWQEKLEFLQAEEAITADPAQKFALKKQIEEAQEKNRQLSG